jgi:hypothetical protein
MSGHSLTLASGIDATAGAITPAANPRPTATNAGGVAAELLVIHNISLPPGEFGGPYIADLFCNRLDFDAHPYFDQLRPLRVSAHFLIRRDGEVVQFVPAHRRAWHAGVSASTAASAAMTFPSASSWRAPTSNPSPRPSMRPWRSCPRPW